MGVITQGPSKSCKREATWSPVGSQSEAISLSVHPNDTLVHIEQT